MGKPDKIPLIFVWLGIPDFVLRLPERLPEYMKGYNGAFGLGGILFVGLMLVLVLMVREKKPSVIVPAGKFNLFGYYKELFGQKQYVYLVLLMIVLNLISTCAGNFNQVFAKFTLGLTPSEAGTIIAIDPLLTLLLAFPIGWLADRLSRRQVIVLSLFFTVSASVCALVTKTQTGMYALVFLWGIGRTLQFVAFVPLIVDYIEPKRMGTFIGGVTQARGIAVFLIGPTIGAIIDVAKKSMNMNAYRIPFAMTILFSILAAYLLHKPGRSQFVEKS